MGKGKLVFKGEKDSKKKKKRKSKHTIHTGNENELGLVREEGGGHDPTRGIVDPTEDQRPKTKAQTPAPPPVAAAAAQATVQKGEGKVTSSGTVLTGHGTIFSKSLRAGDAIIAMVPTNGGGANDGGNCREEMRVITMSLSNTSAAISTAFSYDLKYPTEFRYISKPRNLRKEKTDREKKERIEKEEKERSAFGIYNSGGAGGEKNGTGEQEFVYRERTEHGGYRIRREVITGSDGLARTDLLDLRTKKKSDKYC